MNRFFIPGILLLLNSFLVRAQEPPTVQAPAASKLFASPNVTRPYAIPIDTAVEQRLMDLVLKGPEYDASIHGGKIQALELKKTKSTWLNLLTISTTYNDQSFKQPVASAPGQPYVVYPKYYFGITIPLGIIFSQGTNVKQARESVALGKDNQELLSRNLRVNVLTKYKQYQQYGVLLEMESELLNDVLANASLAEDNFKKGAITVEAYIATQRSKNDEVSKTMTIQLQQDLVRLDIERMTGVPLEEILHPVALPPADQLYRKPVQPQQSTQQQPNP